MDGPHADIGAVHANIDAVQAETREVLETVMHRLELLETSPVPKFVAGLDMNPSLPNETTVAPYHSTIILEAHQSNPEVSAGPGILRRSERLINKSKVDYRQVANKMANNYCCEFESWPNANPLSILILRGPAATR